MVSCFSKKNKKPILAKIPKVGIGIRIFFWTLIISPCSRPLMNTAYPTMIISTAVRFPPAKDRHGALRRCSYFLVAWFTLTGSYCFWSWQCIFCVFQRIRWGIQFWLIWLEEITTWIYQEASRSKIKVFVKVFLCSNPYQLQASEWSSMPPWLSFSNHVHYWIVSKEVEMRRIKLIHVMWASDLNIPSFSWGSLLEGWYQLPAGSLAYACRFRQVCAIPHQEQARI